MALRAFARHRITRKGRPWIGKALDDTLNAIFGDDTASHPTLSRAEEEYEEEHHECPLGESDEELAARLKRENEDILGRKHSDAAKERWHERFDNAASAKNSCIEKYEAPGRAASEYNR